MARIIGKGYSYDDVLVVPKYNKVRSRKEVTFKTRVTRNLWLDNPIIAANMDTVCESDMTIAMARLGGMGIIHRYLTVQEQANQVAKVVEAKALCAAEIGIKDYEERVPALVSAGAQILVLNIAHGHSKFAGKTLEWVKTNYPEIDVMVGNVATKDAAEYFISKGADAIKVGVGPGSMCTTRLMAGAGVPQITAIMDVFEATQGRVPICADGGIRYPGDVVKAIGAGADTVMLGFVLSGTTETPGEIIEENGQKFKVYRGMASYDATLRRLTVDGKKSNEVISVEGEVTRIPFKGPVRPIIERFLGGLASGMTYVGAQDIDHIKGKADFIAITSAGRAESQAHGLRQVR